ncbi:site-specific integrase [Neoroseomonas oryzicola]|uniref:Site-specific integrase n=1 Tax=Neoroseomonas oryzicola TaxID=535904 RepID=A0A9X9WPH7_9PROT|nr:site-specific integrase [Neoroseomonas oryzicola]MBR0662237.1 site-specific integrase [Neoroseomonas oryzicola]NKE19759.1 site-specific integrase [Neoroseomonas oryzicola]
MADVRQRILADEAVPPGRRRDMASALMSLAKAVGRPAEVLPADPQVLRPLLAGLTPAMVGQKPGRWRNILSLSSTALAHAGIVAIQGRIREEPSPAWVAILDLLADGQHRHFNLWRLARYATQQGIEPDAVDDAMIERYRLDLATRSLVSEPDRAARDAARYWNMAVEACPEWPQQRLSIPDNRDTYSLPWDRYPDSLLQEVEAWAAKLSDTSPFGDRGLKPLRLTSVSTRRCQLRLYLGALVQKGIEPSAMVNLATVVAPAMAARGLRYIWERAGEKYSHHLFQMAGMVQMIARHWCKLPTSDVDQLAEMVKQCRPERAGMSLRTKERVRAVAENPERLRQLLLLPTTLIDEARAMPPCEQTAQQVQTAIALEILLFAPIRLRNLQNLRLGVHLLPRQAKGFDISIPASETKNGDPYDAVLPPEVARHITLYLERYRAFLMPAPSDWLFPGQVLGKAKTDDGLRSQIRKAIAIRCGLVLTPHCFRALAGWMVLKKNPGAHGLVQRLLGHKSTTTTMAYYTGLEQVLAVQHYDEMLREEREKAAASFDRAGRRRKAR